MNPNFKLNLLTLSLLAITSIAHAEDEVSTQELDEIQVKGKHIARDLCKIPQNPLNSHQDI